MPAFSPLSMRSEKLTASMSSAMGSLVSFFSELKMFIIFRFCCAALLMLSASKRVLSVGE